jgi:asparagine synthetase B (glutamine-hydrolysing)
MIGIAVTKKDLPINKYYERIDSGNMRLYLFKDANGEIIHKKNKIILSDSKLNNSFKEQTVIIIEKNKILIQKSLLFGKTIYYVFNNKEFFCSTHIRGLESMGVVLKENKKVIPELLVYGYVAPPQTIYRAIKRLLYGQKIVFKILSKKISLHSNKLSNFTSKDKQVPINRITNRLKCSLNKSLKRLNNEKTAVLLSGGIDSSIIYTLFHNVENNKNTVTYSTGYYFDTTNNVEKHNALLASKLMATKHTYVKIPKIDYLNGIIRAIDTAEEPVVYLQSVLMYLLLNDKRLKKYQYFLIGQGADCVFGTQKQQYLMNRKEQYKSKQEILHDYCLDLKFIESEFNMNRNVIEKNRNDLLNFFPNAKDINDKLFILDLLTDVDIVITIWAKFAEPNIAVYPFCSDKVIQIANEVSWNAKLSNNKYVLRSLARTIKVPELIIGSKKSSFGPVSTAWSDELRLLIRKINIPGDRFLNKIIYDKNKRYILWNYINYLIWRRLFIDNVGMDKLLISERL